MGRIDVIGSILDATSLQHRLSILDGVDTILSISLWILGHRYLVPILPMMDIE